MASQIPVGGRRQRAMRGRRGDRRGSRSQMREKQRRPSASAPRRGGLSLPHPKGLAAHSCAADGAVVGTGRLGATGSRGEAGCAGACADCRPPTHRRGSRACRSRTRLRTERASCKTLQAGRWNFHPTIRSIVELGQIFARFRSPAAVCAGFSSRPGKPVAASPFGARARRGMQRAKCHYVTRRSSCNAVKLNTPNIRWHITLTGPRTRMVRPPWLSFSPPLTRSAVLRSP